MGHRNIGEGGGDILGLGGFKPARKEMEVAENSIGGLVLGEAAHRRFTPAEGPERMDLPEKASGGRRRSGRESRSHTSRRRPARR